MFFQKKPPTDFGHLKTVGNIQIQWNNMFHKTGINSKDVGDKFLVF